MVADGCPRATHTFWLILRVQVRSPIYPHMCSNRLDEIRTFVYVVCSLSTPNVMGDRVDVIEWRPSWKSEQNNCCTHSRCICDRMCVCDVRSLSVVYHIYMSDQTSSKWNNTNIRHRAPGEWRYTSKTRQSHNDCLDIEHQRRRVLVCRVIMYQSITLTTQHYIYLIFFSYIRGPHSQKPETQNCYKFVENAMMCWNARVILVWRSHNQMFVVQVFYCTK